MTTNHSVNLDIDGRIITWATKQMNSGSMTLMKLAHGKITCCDLH